MRKGVKNCTQARFARPLTLGPTSHAEKRAITLLGEYSFLHILEHTLENTDQDDTGEIGLLTTLPRTHPQNVYDSQGQDLCCHAFTARQEKESRQAQARRRCFCCSDHPLLG